MYLIGKGHDHEGPGTSMVQRINWTEDNESQLAAATFPGRSGRDALGLGCGCGGSCGATGNCGLGIFDSGMDISAWGWPEWAIVGVGVYAGLSLLGDTRRGVSRVGRVGRAVKKAA
jgi:hypothetical protein